MVIHKIGIVPLARDQRPEAEGQGLCILIHKPRAKDGDADIAWGLARGTRMYFDSDANQWVDARDRITAEANKAQLESPIDTARREMAEELDVHEHEMPDGLVDIGEIAYDSAQKGAYPIHWFTGLVSNPERVRQPEDAVAVKWVTLEELRAMAATGEFKASYLPIAEEIVKGCRVASDAWRARTTTRHSPHVTRTP